MNTATVLVLSTLALSAPLSLAALGGYFSERSGVINIALEGSMLSAACACFLVASASHNAILGLMAGVFAAVCMGWLHWLLTQVYQVDHVISGMAINALALGGSEFFNAQYPLAANYASMPELPHYILHVFGAIQPISIYMVLAYALPFAVLWFSRNTRSGMRLLAVGESPMKARLVGLNPLAIRFWSQTVTGVLCGLAGVLIVDNAGRFTDNITAGRGYIALAALIVGGWRPIYGLVACLGFGFLQALQINLQGTTPLGLHIPVEFWQSLPYLFTVLALAGALSRSRPPRGLGQT